MLSSHNTSKVTQQSIVIMKHVFFLLLCKHVFHGTAVSYYVVLFIVRGSPYSECIHTEYPLKYPVSQGFVSNCMQFSRLFKLNSIMLEGHV